MDKHEIKQGAIYWLELCRCGYADKMRPYMVVSNDKNNAGSGGINVVPLSTSTRRLDLPCNVPVGDIVHSGKPCMVKVNEIYTVSRDLLAEKNWAGQAGQELIRVVSNAIAHQVAVLVKERGDKSYDNHNDMAL